MSVTVSNFKAGDRVKHIDDGTIYTVSDVTADKLYLKGRSCPQEAKYFVKAKMNNFNTPGFKDDSSKPDVELLFSSFPRALLEVATIADHGAKKYTRDGWTKVEDGRRRYMGALGRHLLKRYIDGEYDGDSHLRHLAHSAWNALAVLELALKEDERSE